MDLDGKKVVVLGAGRSGRAAAQLAHLKGASVEVYDANPKANFSDWPNGIVGTAGASVELGKSICSDVLVLSPGIDTYGEFVRAFSERTEELIGEVELASRFYQGTVVGITGTNGKTTTTALIEHMIQGAGQSCVACGNYGKPFSEVIVDGNPPQYVALELSSFQLETVGQFKADVAIWLNFSADHMDRYRDLNDYFEAKKHIFENQTANDTAIVRKGESLGDLTAKTVTFSSDGDAADYYLDNGTVMFHGQALLSMHDSSLRGTHNAENVMAALATLKALGLEGKQQFTSVASFTAPPHRCEFVGKRKEVEYVNDSKATNLHALESALVSLEGDIVLLAGGKDKGLDYNELLPTLKENTSAVIVFGQIADVLESCFHPAVETHTCKTLEEAVLLAAKIAKPNSTVLLSPGTSSFDQFPSYEARGDHFKKLVEALPA